MEKETSKRTPDRARRPWFGRVVLALAVLALGVEAAFRIDDWRAGREAGFYMPPTSATLYEPHPYLGFVLVPGEHVTRKLTFHINALGMRGREMQAHKPPGTYRILCLGGSTTFGTGASADDRTYPARLEQLLNSRAEEAGMTRRYEVGNCGVVDWNSADNLINLELRLLEYEPDAILYYGAANDGRLVALEGFRPDFSHARQPVRRIEITGLETFLLGHVRTFARLARGTDPREQYSNVDFAIFRPGLWDHQVAATRERIEEGVRVFIRNVRSMLAVARANGIELVLSTFAMRAPDAPGEGDRQPAFIRRANEELRALATAESLPLIEADAALSGKPALFQDFMHLNDDGELRHAEVVSQQARAAGLFGLR